MLKCSVNFVKFKLFSSAWGVVRMTMIVEEERKEEIDTCSCTQV